MQFLRITAVAGLLALLSVGSTSRLPAAANPEGKDFIRPETVRGCYDLGVLKWRPDLQLDKDEAVFITPPERIELLAERGSQGSEIRGYMVRPAPGVPKSVHRFTYWRPTGPNKIEVMFTTGLSGLEMQLTLKGDTLEGKANTFWDFLRRRQTARVIAHKIKCTIDP